MLARIVAVGTRMPSWSTQAVETYLKRLPPEWRCELREVRAEPRGTGGTPAQWMAREAQRIRAALDPGMRIVVLDERGRDLDTAALAARMQAWRDEAQVAALLIGGPDGLDPSLRREARETWRLSSLTLPHPLARVVLAEQLYRGWSVIARHPYHRE